MLRCFDRCLSRKLLGSFRDWRCCSYESPPHVVQYAAESSLTAIRWGILGTFLRDRLQYSAKSSDRGCCEMCFAIWGWRGSSIWATWLRNSFLRVPKKQVPRVHPREIGFAVSNYGAERSRKQRHPNQRSETNFGIGKDTIPFE